MSAVRSRLSAPERRESMLGAAREVFVESGFAAARIKEIAARAGINEALLYQHFSSKEEMFEEAVAQPLEDALRAAAAAAPPVSGDDGPEVVRERLESFIRRLVELMSELSPLLGATLFEGDERSASFYNERFLPVVDELSGVVEHNLSHWQPREFDIRLTIMATIGMCLMVSLDRRVSAGPASDVDGTAHELTGLILNGLADPR